MKTRIKIKGFTLVELIIVISLMGIMVAVVGAFMSRPFEVYDAQSRRSNLVTIVTSALVNMKRNVSQAVPNSIRVTSAANIISLELMQVTSGGRYRSTDTVDDDLGLLAGQADDQFNTLGNINNPSGGLANTRLIVNPIDTTRLYSAAEVTTWTAVESTHLGMITPLQTGVTTVNHTVGTQADPEDTIILPVNPYRFDPIGSGSDRKRFYLSDTPIMYVCDLTAGTLTRYSDYTPSLVSSVPPSGSPTNNLVMNNLSFCSITFDPGSATRISYVTITLGAAIDGEEIRIVQQLQVSNSP